MKTGIELITQERQEQIEKHGWTKQHDFQEHDNGAIDKAFRAVLLSNGRHDLSMFPYGWEKFAEKVIEKTYKEKLVIVAALIAAEIDRLQEEENLVK